MDGYRDGVMDLKMTTCGDRQGQAGKAELAANHGTDRQSLTSSSTTYRRKR